MESKEIKLELFEYLSHSLITWFCEETGQNISAAEQNFSKLKFVKLHFFVCAASIADKNSDLLSRFDNFYAMPYGHVESDVYNGITDIKSFAFSYNGFKIINSPTYTIDDSLKDLVNSSVSKLRAFNKDIIKYDPIKLVELSHSWLSWKYVYEYARKRNKYSMPIPSDLIRNEPKFYVIE